MQKNRNRLIPLIAALALGAAAPSYSCAIEEPTDECLAENLKLSGRLFKCMAVAYAKAIDDGAELGDPIPGVQKCIDDRLIEWTRHHNNLQPCLTDGSSIIFDGAVKIPIEQWVEEQVINLEFGLVPR